MIEHGETLQWQRLVGPLAETSMALGRLQHALVAAPLHPAWLWRETVRAAATIGQNAGYRVTHEQLARDLLGLPVDQADKTSGLAAGRRLFLSAAAIFRDPPSTDSSLAGSAVW